MTPEFPFLPQIIIDSLPLSITYPKQEPEPMNGGYGKGGYDYHVVRLTGQNIDEEAGMFHLPPGIPSRPVRINQPTYSLDLPVIGSCTALILRQTGNIEAIPYQPGEMIKPVFYSNGDVVTWIPDQNSECWILATYLSWPSGCESGLKIDDPHIPPQYWARYHELIGT